MNEKATTADRLKQLMQERNLKQVDILTLCKPFCIRYNLRLGKNDLSQYISGKVKPKQDKLTLLALALNVNEAWLMGYNVPMERKKADNNMDNNESIHLSSNEQKLVTNYRTLNEDGQERLLEYSEDMVLSGRYIKTDKNGLLEKEA